MTCGLHVVVDLIPPLWHTLLCRWRGVGVLCSGGLSDGAAAAMVSRLLRVAPLPDGVAHTLAEQLRQAVHRHAIGGHGVPSGGLCDVLQLALPAIIQIRPNGPDKTSELLELPTLHPAVLQALVVGVDAEYTAARTSGRNAYGASASTIIPNVTRRLITLIGRVEDAPLAAALRAVADYEAYAHVTYREKIDPLQVVAGGPVVRDASASKRRRVDKQSFESTGRELLCAVLDTTTRMTSGAVDTATCMAALRAQHVYFRAVHTCPLDDIAAWKTIAASWGLCLGTLSAAGEGAVAAVEVFGLLIPVVAACVRSATGPDSPLLAESVSVGALLWTLTPKFRNQSADLQQVWQITSDLCTCADALQVHRDQFCARVKDGTFAQCIELILEAAMAAPQFAPLALAIVSQSLRHERPLVIHAAVRATPRLIPIAPDECERVVDTLRQLLSAKQHSSALFKAVAAELTSIVRASHPADALPLLVGHFAHPLCRLDVGSITPY